MAAFRAGACQHDIVITNSHAGGGLSFGYGDGLFI